MAVPKIWERPALGVAVIIVLIAVPWRTGGEGAEVAHVTLPDIAAATLAGIVAVRTLVLGDQGRLRSWVILPLAGVVVAGSVATLTASDPAASISGLVRYAEIFVVVPAATYLALQSRRDLKLILAVVIALGVFEGAIGVYQFFTGTGAAIGGANARAVGTFGAYNIMGLANVVTYALIAATATFVGLQDGRRLWGLLLMLALLFPLAFSLSRGAWIAAAVGVMVVVALGDWKKLVFFVLVGGLALVITSGVVTPGGPASGDPGVTTERLNSLYSVGSTPDQSTLDRYAMWQAARGMWADHPLTGVGLKNFPHFRDVYAPLSFSGGSDIQDSDGFRRVELLSPHNLYWLVLAEQGLVGAFAYGALFLSLGIAGFKRLPKLEESSVERVFALSSLGLLASYLISSVYGDVGGSTMVLDAVVLFGGLVWLASGTQLNEEIN
ncbi:MAG: O-antigen ligase family protein [Actinomycetota bacterium]|nr:O-antigen ligase family protein [Actinomycetota bacterium]